MPIRRADKCGLSHLLPNSAVQRTAQKGTPPLTLFVMPLTLKAPLHYELEALLSDVVRGPSGCGCGFLPCSACTRRRPFPTSADMGVKSCERLPECCPLGYCNTGIKSPGQAQRFLSVHSQLHNLFRVGRHLLRACHYRLFRERSFSTWQEVTCAC